MIAALSALDQAMYVHQKWSESVHASLICHLAPDARDLSDDAYRLCPFGQWYYLPQNEGLGQHPGFLAIASEHEQMHHVATQILLASQSGEHVLLRDYETFVNAMSRMRLEILTLSRELEDSLTNLDPLTGAASRLGMLPVLRRQQELVKRNLQRCMIIMFDLDRFKDVNDNFGHQAGDRVLINIVQFVRSRLRPYDEFFRYGGEEFLVCTPGQDGTNGSDAIERLREGIAEMRIELDDGRIARITASFGVTTLDPDVPVEVSIARADKALYAAKAAGRDCVRRWDPTMD
ncbi:MAG: diguanylate cyclase [Acidimicrobiales bacterium]